MTRIISIMFKKIFLAILILFVIIFAGVWAYLNFSSDTTTTLDSEMVKQLDQLMDDSLKKYQTPGMTMGIWIPGQGAFVKAKGLADVSTKQKMNTNYLFRIGSMTKTFTATIVLQLIDEGKLSLDDSVSKFEPFPGSRNITIKELLNMTSGLYNYTELDWLDNDFLADRNKYYAPEFLLDAGIDHRPNFLPGRGFHYSNTNYVLLGLIIEKVTGNRLQDEYENRIIKKLGLKNTYYPTDNTIHGKYSHGYMLEDGQLVDWTDQNISWGWAAGGLISNMYDLKKYIKAISDGTFLSPKMQEARLNDWVAMSAKVKAFEYGFGVFTYKGFVGHNGGLPGFVNLAMYNPKTGAIILFMLNTQPQEGDATLEILKEVVEIIG